MKTRRKIIEIDESKCDGCGLCVPSCAEGAIIITDGKARLVAEKYCDGLGACLGECPSNALRIIEREVDEYDEKSVHEHLKEQVSAKGPVMACGCPSALVRDFSPERNSIAASVSPAPTPATAPEAESALTHWPVQIKLVPPHAPFLKGADLLVAADCAPAAYPRFHEEFLKGKVLLIGCPKFDDAAEYVQKFAAIFSRGDIRSVTVLVMEVPCCQALPAIVKKGMEMAGTQVPLKKEVISVRGKLLHPSQGE
jgi:Pyruvate/2-oxoacid:ferredoxin oxidoreductase delta subunit